MLLLPRAVPARPLNVGGAFGIQPFVKLIAPGCSGSGSG